MGWLRKCHYKDCLRNKRTNGLCGQRGVVWTANISRIELEISELKYHFNCFKILKFQVSLRPHRQQQCEQCLAQISKNASSSGTNGRHFYGEKTSVLNLAALSLSSLTNLQLLHRKRQSFAKIFEMFETSYIEGEVYLPACVVWCFFFLLKKIVMFLLKQQQ